MTSPGTLRRILPLLLLGCAMPLLTGACAVGGTSNKDAIEGSQETVNAWLAAIQKQDYKAACGLMDDRPVKGWATDCPKAYMQRLAKPLAHAKLVAGSANVTGSSDDSRVVTLLVSPVSTPMGKPHLAKGGKNYSLSGEVDLTKGTCDRDFCINGTPYETSGR